MGCIYYFLNKINKKGYIGQTVQKPDTRKKQHFKPTSNCLYLRRAFVKYGIDNFDFKVIFNCPDEELDRYEIQYMHIYNTLVPNGYNLREGGNSSKMNEETKLKISRALKLKYSDPSYINPLLGKKGLISEDTRKKLSDAKKGRIISAETIEKNKLASLKHKVIQMDLQGNIIKTYDGIVEAGKAIGTTRVNIHYACTGKRLSANGFKFKYESLDYNQNNIINEIVEDNIIELNKEKLKEVIKYINENGKKPSIYNVDENTKNLGNWIIDADKKYNLKNGYMSNETMYNLWTEFTNKYNDSFLSNDDNWFQNFNKVKTYMDDNGIPPRRKNIDKNIQSMATWIVSQKKIFIEKTGIMKDSVIYNKWKDFADTPKYNKLLNSRERVKAKAKTNENLITDENGIITL